MLSFQLSYSLEVKQSNKEIKFRVKGHYRLIYSNDWSILDSNLYLNNSTSKFGNKIPLKKIKYYEELVGTHSTAGFIVGLLSSVYLHTDLHWDEETEMYNLQYLTIGTVLLSVTGMFVGYHIDDWEKFDMEEYVNSNKISFNINPYYNNLNQLNFYGVSLSVNF